MLGQESREALADDDGVVGEDHAHGIAALTRVPPPGGALDQQAAVEASTRSRRPRSPAPAGSAPPTPSSVTSIATRPFARMTSMSDAGGICVLDDVGERFGRDEVDGRLDGGWEPLRTDGQVDRHGRTPRERGECGWEAFLGQDRRVDAACERAQLAEGVDDLGVRLGEELVRRRTSVGEPAAGELEREPDPEQALLRSVMEVALEPPPLGVAGLDDPRPRGAHLCELGAQLCLQARVLEREAGRGADGLEELGLVEERRVMDENCEALPVVLEHGDGAPGLLLRVERGSVRVDVAFVLGQPEGELEGRIAERARDRVTHLRTVCSGEPSSTTRAATAERCSRVRSRPARKASGTMPTATMKADSRTEPSGVS